MTTRLITEKMRAAIGTATAPLAFPDAISDSDVRRFISVIGETNPIYHDAAYAQRLGYRGRVVPPIYVVALLFRRFTFPDGSASRVGIDWPQLRLPPGYTNTRNAGQEYTWFQPVYVGDQLTVAARLSDIFVRRGRAGIPAIYLVSETEIHNQAGARVVLQTSTNVKLPAAPAKAS